MTGEVEKFDLNKVNESITGLNDKLSGLQKNIIDDNLDTLDVGGKISDLLGKVSKVLDVNLFGLGTASSLLGVKIFDIEKYKNKGGIWNIVFKKYGGIEGLHKTYVTETLSGFFSDQPERQTLIGDMYTSYQGDKVNNSSTDQKDTDGLLNFVASLGMEDAAFQALTSKLPQVKMSFLSKVILDAIKGKEENLDPNVLAECGYSPERIVAASGREIIKSENFDRTKIDQTLIDIYVQNKLTQLLSEPGFTKYIQSPDHLVLALFGGLFVSGNTFAEAVLLGIKKPEDFGVVQEQEEKDPDTTPEVYSTTVLDMKEDVITEEFTKVKSPLTAQMLIKAATKYTVPVSYMMAIMKNDSSYGTAGLAVSTHNPGNVGNMDDGSKKDRGTREAGVDAVADNLRKRIDAYHAKFGDDTHPSIQELASGKKSDTQENFFGVYMTAPKGPEIVQSIQENLGEENILPQVA